MYRTGCRNFITPRWILCLTFTPCAERRLIYNIEWGIGNMKLLSRGRRALLKMIDCLQKDLPVIRLEAILIQTLGYIFTGNFIIYLFFCSKNEL